MKQTIRLLEKCLQENDLLELISTLESKDFIAILNDFVASKRNDKLFCYWWSYMEMVHILLLFIRAQRDGLRELHIHTFQRMLPFFMRQYDHTIIHAGEQFI